MSYINGASWDSQLSLSLLQLLTVIMYKLIVFAVLLEVCSAFPSFRGRIPNGFNVTNPCPSGGVWQAVGHFNSTAGGETNPFGDDFASTGYTWTESLCKTDSDLDGLTNGEELGDPQCTWRVGNNVALNDPKGHPGLCEPFSAPACKNQRDVCKDN
ncbi:temptin-like isoform X1 [Biomphalaria glabrata]|uniref:Temptin-like isoform X1 n=2 Tax=Biomphalaria glabrata TaxID=6526 RepID=A0A9U8EFU7_BIOGL|nr:temptin-like isoform X1 [Biomphalaria glabrata]